MVDYGDSPIRYKKHTFLTFRFSQKTSAKGKSLPYHVYSARLKEFFDDDKLEYRTSWFKDPTYRIDFYKLANVDIEKTKKDLCDLMEPLLFFEWFERSSMEVGEWKGKYPIYEGDTDSDVEVYWVLKDTFGGDDYSDP